MTAIQLDGRVYCSNAVLQDGRFCLRSCIVNYRTEAEDMDALLDVASELGAKLDVELRPEACDDLVVAARLGRVPAVVRAGRPSAGRRSRRRRARPDPPDRVGPEGKDVFERWGSARSRTSRDSIAAEVLELKTRETRTIRGCRTLEGASAVYSPWEPRLPRVDARGQRLPRGDAEAARPGDGVRGLQRRRRVPQRAHVRQRHDRHERGLEAGPEPVPRRCSHRTGTWSTRGCREPRVPPLVRAGGSTFIGMDEDTAMVGTGGPGR